MRDFFSFLREIFFYTKAMDLTDHALALDMLSILNDSIRRNSRHDLQQSYHAAQSSVMHMQDCFFFSKVSRGVLLLNELQLNAKDEIFMSLLFKIHVDQIQEELDVLNQQRSSVQGILSQAEMHDGVQARIQRMVLVSFLLKGVDRCK